MLSLRRAESILFHLLIFFLPTQLTYHFWPNWAFVFGIRVDYLSPAIYLTDGLIVVLLLLWYLRVKLFPKFVLILIVFALVNSLFSIYPFVSLAKWVKVIEMSLFAFYVSNNKDLLKTKDFLKVAGLSLSLFSLIGILQFLKGSTLGGLLYFVGERSFNISTPGIALENIFGREFIRPYSTFPHPNSLAGYFGLFLILFPGISKLSKILSGFAVLISGSLSSYIGIAASILFRKFSRVLLVTVILLSLILPILSISGGGEGVAERLVLAKEAGEIISNKFFFGSGLNTFVVQNPLLQPVHNIFLLVFSELGIFGLLGLSWLIFKGYKKFPAAFIFILLTGFFDHYWLTLQQNMLLLALVFGLVF